MKKVLLILVAVIGFGICAKLQAQTGTPVQLVETIIDIWGNKSKYEYDSKNRITKITEYNPKGTRITLIKYTYNSAGELVEYNYKIEEGEWDGFISFEKKGNEISFYGDEKEGDIVLNTWGLPMEIKTIYDMDSYLEWSGKHCEYNNNGDLNSVVTTTTNTLDNEYFYSSIYYAYDNKNNNKSPFYYCKTPKWYFVFSSFSEDYGLISNIRMIQYEPSRFNTDDAAYTYTYDSAGFPLTQHDPEGKVLKTFTYIKK